LNNQTGEKPSKKFKSWREGERMTFSQHLGKSVRGWEEEGIFRAGASFSLQSSGMKTGATWRKGIAN